MIKYSRLWLAVLATAAVTFKGWAASSQTVAQSLANQACTQRSTVYPQAMARANAVAAQLAQCTASANGTSATVAGLRQQLAAAQQENASLRANLAKPPAASYKTHTTSVSRADCSTKVVSAMGGARLTGVARLGEYYYYGFAGACVVTAICLGRNQGAEVQDVVVTAACSAGEDPVALARAVDLNLRSR